MNLSFFLCDLHHLFFQFNAKVPTTCACAYLTHTFLNGLIRIGYCTYKTDKFEYMQVEIDVICDVFFCKTTYNFIMLHTCKYHISKKN